MGQSEEEVKNHLMRLKEEMEKAGLKLDIQKMKIITSGPIISWKIEGSSDRLYFLGIQDHCRR